MGAGAKTGEKVGGGKSERGREKGLTREVDIL